MIIKTLVSLFAFLVLLCASAYAKDFSPTECPYVGNTNSQIYHKAGGRFYAKMLRENHSLDNRKCFKTEAAAKKAGYRASKV